MSFTIMHYTGQGESLPPYSAIVGKNVSLDENGAFHGTPESQYFIGIIEEARELGESGFEQISFPEGVKDPLLLVFGIANQGDFQGAEMPVRERTFDTMQETIDFLLEPSNLEN